MSLPHMKIEVEERVLHFKQPAGTSRGVYTTRTSWFVTISDGDCKGVGECAPLPDLSCDAMPNYGEKLKEMSKEFAIASMRPCATTHRCSSALRRLSWILIMLMSFLIRLFHEAKWASP